MVAAWLTAQGEGRDYHDGNDIWQSTNNSKEDPQVSMTKLVGIA